MQIDWWTFALQGVNFLVLVWLLRRFLYRPVNEVIDKRKQLAKQLFDEADKQKRAAEEARLGYENAQAGLAKERQNMLKNNHDELVAERQTVLDEARGQAEELMAATRESITQERELALTEFREQVATLAVELASTLLRKSGSHISSDLFLQQIEQQLKEMRADERVRLQKDLTGDRDRLTVVTATPLTAAERQRWIDRLDPCFGQSDKTDFVCDPEILGGAELRFPHAVLKFSWADQLGKAKTLLEKDDAAS